MPDEHADVGAAAAQVVPGRERHNARWYFTGLTASLVGNSAMSLVAGIWVKALTGSSASAGLVSAAVYAPALVAPVSGLIADHFPRRRLLLILNLLAAVTVLPLIAVHSPAAVWVVFAVMLAYGLEATVMDPAEDALFAELFTLQLRRRLNGRRLAIQETGRLLAPLLGAGLFAAAGGGAVAALDAGTFLFAALVLTRLAADDQRPAPAHGDQRLGRELLAGAAHIWKTAAIRRIAIAATAVMALSGTVVAAQYSLVQGLGQRPAFLGVFTALLGAGSVIASLSSGRLINRVGERTVATVGLLNFAAGNLLRASGWMPTALLGSLILGFALPYVFLAILNVAQAQTPLQLQGRVSAALLLLLFGPQASAQALGALLIAHCGYRQIYAIAALLSLSIAVWLVDRFKRSTTTGHT